MIGVTGQPLFPLSRQGLLTMVEVEQDSGVDQEVNDAESRIHDNSHSPIALNCFHNMKTINGCHHNGDMAVSSPLHQELTEVTLKENRKNEEDVSHDSGSESDGKVSSPDSQKRQQEAVTSEHRVYEADKIQEFLNRKDTAVIFPEPPSDQEEAALENTAKCSDKENCQDEKSIPFQCPHCECGYSDLQEHLQTFHSDTLSRHSCPECQASFVLKAHLDKHLTTHSPTSQACKICNKTFANVYRLQRHMISHEESTELRKFKCMECGKAFKFKHHLKEHIRIHSGEKPFECSNCGKRFSHSGSFSSHMTSKKCWVVNVRMRRDRTSERQDGLLRPLVPKAGENGLDVASMASMYANMYPPVIPFGQPGAPFPSPYLAHLHGGHPWAHIPYSVAHMMNPMMPPPINSGAYGPPTTDKVSPSVIAKEIWDAHERNISNKSHEEVSQEYTSPSKLDENQNKKSIVLNGSQDATSDETKKTESATEESTAPTSSSPAPSRSSITDENDESDQTNAGAAAADVDLIAVKRVLEIVDATVTQQKKEEKVVLSKLVTGESATTNADPSLSLNALATAASEQLRQLENEEEENKDKADETEEKQMLTCQYCQQNFDSHVELHQHERYVCKNNNEIYPTNLLSPPLNGSTSPASVVTEDGSLMEDKDGQTCRVRSLIADNQQKMLKAYYKTNPFPSKFDLARIASELAFSKRVVQVWFQNMRARDRRKGKQLPERPTGGVSQVIGGGTRSEDSAFIPVVPQISVNGEKPSSSESNVMCYSGPKMNGQLVRTVFSGSSSAHNLTYTMQVEPLDLSVKKLEDVTHAKICQVSTPPPVEDGVLNLCTKMKSENPSERTSSPNNPGFEESVIFKYMQKEGMISNDEKTGNHSNRSTPHSHPPLVTHSNHVTAPHSFVNTVPAHSGQANLHVQKSPERPLSRDRPLLTSTPAGASPPIQTCRSPGVVSRDMTSPLPSSLETSFNSSVSLESLTMEQHFNGLGGKIKRARRKSWRQMESDFQLAFDETAEDDEDQPLRKKRRSWKQHRIEAADGLYACDQCDKMFAKQSSLARHKYEHSGQRPFPCDICGKAFKHKHHLTEHKRLHSGEKPFECKKCGKRFSHSGSFSQHMNHRYKYCKPLGLDGEPEPIAMTA